MAKPTIARKTYHIPGLKRKKINKDYIAIFILGLELGFLVGFAIYH